MTAIDYSGPSLRVIADRFRRSGARVIIGNNSLPPLSRSSPPRSPFSAGWHRHYCVPWNGRGGSRPASDTPCKRAKRSPQRLQQTGRCATRPPIRHHFRWIIPGHRPGQRLIITRTAALALGCRNAGALMVIAASKQCYQLYPPRRYCTWLVTSLAPNYRGTQLAAIDRLHPAHYGNDNRGVTDPLLSSTDPHHRDGAVVVGRRFLGPWPSRSFPSLSTAISSGYPHFPRTQRGGWRGGLRCS